MLTKNDYPDMSCACSTCAGYCKRFPCRPLPEEVKAMPRELRARLMLNYFQSANGYVFYLQAAAVGHESGEVPDSIYGYFGLPGVPHRCTFLTEDDKCELHGTHKPYEGRKSVCGGRYPDGHKETVHALGFRDRLSEVLFEAWNTDEGRRIVQEWEREFQR